MEKELACSDCKPKFVVPTKTTTYRSCECHCQVVCKSTSGYKQSRENCLGAKLFNQTQLHTASRIAPGHSSSLSSTTTINNKRAVLCGVTYSYSGRRYTLKGTVNDVINKKHLLVEKFAFPIQSIRVLTEEQKDPNFIPTKRNIMESLKWLVKDCKLGDSLVFYFSGRGTQQPPHDEKNEIDGFDETICPVDFITAGMIAENEINSTIVVPLKEGVKLHAIC